jgi:hypothetical protein
MDVDDVRPIPAQQFSDRSSGGKIVYPRKKRLGDSQSPAIELAAAAKVAGGLMTAILQ